MYRRTGRQTVVIRNVDVYPVTGPEMKGVSIVLQDGKIGEIGAKILPPKGARIIEGKGLRVYPGMIDSGTELGLSEVSAVRETVDTGELGEFMPQLRALSAVNPESEHFGVVRVNGITSVMTFPSSGGGAGGGGGRFGGGERQFISGQAALIHTDGWTWEDMAIDRTAAVHLIFPTLGGRGGRGGGVPDVVLEMVPGGAGATGFTAAKRPTISRSPKLTNSSSRPASIRRSAPPKRPASSPCLSWKPWFRSSKARFP